MDGLTRIANSEKQYLHDAHWFYVEVTFFFFFWGGGGNLLSNKLDRDFFWHKLVLFKIENTCMNIVIELSCF